MNELPAAAFALYTWVGALKNYSQVVTSLKPDRAKVAALQKSAEQLQKASNSRLKELDGLHKGLDMLKVLLDLMFALRRFPLHKHSCMCYGQFNDAIV